VTCVWISGSVSDRRIKSSADLSSSLFMCGTCTWSARSARLELRCIQSLMQDRIKETLIGTYLEIRERLLDKTFYCSEVGKIFRELRLYMKDHFS
jgi:hypothetical protein